MAITLYQPRCRCCKEPLPPDYPDDYCVACRDIITEEEEITNARPDEDTES